jgi:hypothetical protein
MKKSILSLVLMVSLQGFSNSALAEAAHDGFHNNWLMMVKTQNTNPAKDGDFNDWYNKVDIPDVLEVPGYMRARRGFGQVIPEFPTPDLQGDKGKYIALYNIKTANMDKTIIDMLMASWEMEKEGHSTNLLKVTERVYFHQYTPTYDAPDAKPAGKNKYLYVVKINCCRDKTDTAKFDAWYDKTYIPAVMKAEEFIRTTRYELYRVLMIKPVKIPPFLAVYEVEAESADQALKNMQKAVDKLAAAGAMSNLYVTEGATIYQTVQDVKRK